METISQRLYNSFDFVEPAVLTRLAGVPVRGLGDLERIFSKLTQLNDGTTTFAVYRQFEIL